MPRYFIEVGYKGTGYAGFQEQKNANTIQAEVEKALGIYFRAKFELTGSSRTDAGVHALQNFFHFDFEPIHEPSWSDVAYHLNAILPAAIVVKSIKMVEANAHCRFDAVSRTYEYTIYRSKNPFLEDRAYYFPYRLEEDLLNRAAECVRNNMDFEAFCKRNTQVHTYICDIMESGWMWKDSQQLVYRVSGNRFLRGMVRGLVGTMLRVGTGKIDLMQFQRIIESGDSSKADFSTPPHGLTLISVTY